VAVFGGVEVEQGRTLRADGRIDHGDVRIGDSLVMAQRPDSAGEPSGPTASPVRLHGPWVGELCSPWW
jgi:hypothetical protein